MSVRWTERALADLDSIFDAVAADRPNAARRLIRLLLSQGAALRAHPRRGRPGRLPETRELVVPGLPYVIVYALKASLTEVAPEATILRVIHGAMRWPPES